MEADTRYTLTQVCKWLGGVRYSAAGEVCGRAGSKGSDIRLADASWASGSDRRLLAQASAVMGTISTYVMMT